ncbi:tRNA (adenosine(37)-N6)-threonylcarbamoyltransferase complex dimerization subunit type 1 TsaB [Ruegeria sp. SCPT10]|uniref:tRNA (adenosine(37)-N6)-threonylcarbamoyltransferase complex dimerization subunit type 1 TsaB n=1 Tax=Ruegeria sp. SCP10 TaxID=3141377 RepID=UPI0033387BA9
MPSDPTILAFDTSAAHCAAALLRDGQIIVSTAEAMSRGQAERLMPFLEEVLEQAGCIWADLDAIGVGVGPGNFTGIRISVSAARGLALGLGVPAVGVSGFDALAEIAPNGQIPAIQAPREQVYLQQGDGPAQLMPKVEACTLGQLFFCSDPAAQAEAIAKVAVRHWKDVSDPPAPLYVRAADAAPSSDQPPVLLDE